MTQVPNYVVEDGTGLDVLASLNAILAALRDENAGISPPPNPIPGMRWLDTSGLQVSQNPRLFRYVRNAANTLWIRAEEELDIPFFSGFGRAALFTQSGFFHRPSSDVTRGFALVFGGGGGTLGSSSQTLFGGVGGLAADYFDLADAVVPVVVGAGGSGVTGGAGGDSDFQSIIGRGGGAVSSVFRSNAGTATTISLSGYRTDISSFAAAPLIQPLNGPLGFQYGNRIAGQLDNTPPLSNGGQTAPRLYELYGAFRPGAAGGVTPVNGHGAGGVGGAVFIFY